jgi:putative ABC transport system permease protein
MNALPRLLQALINAHRHAPGQALLMLLALSLSVAVVVAIDLSIDSARSAFSEARRALSGSATHQIVSDGAPVPDALLAQLRREGVRASAPVIDLEAAIGASKTRLRLFAIDPLSEARIRPWLAGGGALSGDDTGIDYASLIGDADGALLPQALAQRLQLRLGDKLALVIDGRPVHYVVRGLLADDTLPATSTHWIVLDIAAGQRALGSAGYSRIDLVLDAPTAQRLAGSLPLGLRLLATAEQDRDLALMSRAFEINLKALSLLALLVGLFVVFQTLSFLTLRRGGVIGLWRAIGVDRRTLAALLLGEAAWVGVIAGLLGIGLGILLGRVLLVGIDVTYADLYGRGATGALTLAPLLIAKGMLLSIGGSLLAVLLPLYEVLTQTAMQALGRTRSSRAEDDPGVRRIRALALPSLVLFVIGAVALKFGPDTLVTAFSALFVCLLACLGLVPWLAWALLLILERRLRDGAVLPLWLLAGTRRGLGRTGIALAALCLAIATVIGMSSMIHSFRSAVAEWIDQSLQADVYVSSAGRNALAPEVIDAARALPGVNAISQTRRSQHMLDSGPISVIGLDLPLAGRGSIDWIAGDQARVWEALAAGDAVISEPLATRLKLAPGDSLILPAASGPTAVRIAAIYRDYASSQGALTLALDHYQRLFADTRIGAIGIYADQASVPSIVAALQSRVISLPGVQVVSAADIRERTLAIFARTFAVTDLLRLLAGLIAVVAVIGALSALAIERRREFALLRSLGLASGRLLRLQWLQASLLGLIAGLLALPLGIGLAVLLIEVINRRSFGWSMQLQLPWDQLLAAIAIAVVSAMLAGTWPARQQRRSSLARQLREAPL